MTKRSDHKKLVRDYGLIILFGLLFMAKFAYAALVTDSVKVVNLQNDVMAEISSAGTFAVEPRSELSSSTSAGGAIRLDNTLNKGAGLVMYTNSGSGSNGRLVSARCDHAYFDQDCLHVSNDGERSGIGVLTTKGPAMTLSSSTTTPKNHVLGLVLQSQVTDTSALNVFSDNNLHSAMQVTGQERVE